MHNFGTRSSNIWRGCLLGAKLFRVYPFQYKTPQSACKKIQSIGEGALSGNSPLTLDLKHAFAGEDQAPVPEPFFIRTRRAIRLLVWP